VYVHASVKDAFVKHCVDALDSIYGHDNKKIDSPDLARIVNPRHVARIKGLLDDATSRGARVISGGQYDESKRFIAPTLLDGIPEDADH
jgi:aldehyde dehydrogenase (NAD+)